MFYNFFVDPISKFMPKNQKRGSKSQRDLSMIVLLSRDSRITKRFANRSGARERGKSDKLTFMQVERG